MRTSFLRPGFLVFLLFACRDASNERIDGIQRVLMHDVDEYSLMIADGAGVASLYKVYADAVTFVRDVPEGKPMWAELQRASGCHGRGGGASLAIHLHGTAEVEGAGWDRGKGGQGRVNVVE